MSLPCQYKEKKRKENEKWRDIRKILGLSFAALTGEANVCEKYEWYFQSWITSKVYGRGGVIL